MRQVVLTHRWEIVGTIWCRIRGDISMERGAAGPRSWRCPWMCGNVLFTPVEQFQILEDWFTNGENSLLFILQCTLALKTAHEDCKIFFLQFCFKAEITNCAVGISQYHSRFDNFSSSFHYSFWNNYSLVLLISRYYQEGILIKMSNLPFLSLIFS